MNKCCPDGGIRCLLRCSIELCQRCQTASPSFLRSTIWSRYGKCCAACSTHAPTGGANLLGGIGDDIAVLADGLGLRDRVTPHLGSTGNTAIWLGADKPAADLVVTAHMDRASFRALSVDEGTLYPLCANRFPAGENRVPAKAVRFERGRLVVSADGMLVSSKQGVRIAAVRA
jgi:hypothetical protein